MTKNDAPFELTQENKRLHNVKRKHEKIYNTHFENLMIPQTTWVQSDTGIRLEFLFSQRIKDLCNGKVSEISIERAEII